MDRVSKHTTKKTYDYFSRYQALSAYYNNLDKKRYYEVSIPLSKDITSFIKHIVVKNDTLDSIALKYYSNPLYWWIIADINNIQDPFKLKEGIELIIPYLNQVKF